MRRPPLVFALTLASCTTVPTSEGADASSSDATVGESGPDPGSETGTSGATSETGEPPACEPACPEQCSGQRPLCELDGAYCQRDGTCECAWAPDCLACDPESCPLGWACADEFTTQGHCELVCNYESEPIPWDAQHMCVLPLSATAASLVHGYGSVVIDGMELPASEDPMICDATPGGVALWWADDMLHLCPAACARWEMGELIFRWDFPCTD